MKGKSMSLYKKAPKKWKKLNFGCGKQIKTKEKGRISFNF